MERRGEETHRKLLALTVSNVPPAQVGIIPVQEREARRRDPHLAWYTGPFLHEGLGEWKLRGHEGRGTGQ